MAAREASHSHVCASDQAVNFVGFGQIEGVMGDDDARAILAACFEPRATPGYLLVADAAIFKSERAGGIDSYNRDFIVAVERLELLADVALVISKRFHQAGQNIVQRYVVIPRDYNLRRRKSVQKLTGFLK